MRIANLTRNAPIADDASIATSPWARFRGLMLKEPAEFGDGQALIIDPCTSIHMFFMRFPLDVLYLDRDNCVVRTQESIRPWRIGPLYTKGARYVIELPAGTIARTGTRAGDQLLITA